MDVLMKNGKYPQSAHLKSAHLHINSHIKLPNRLK